MFINLVAIASGICHIPNVQWHNKYSRRRFGACDALTLHVHILVGDEGRNSVLAKNNLESEMSVLVLQKPYWARAKSTNERYTRSSAILQFF